MMLDSFHFHDSVKCALNNYGLCFSICEDSIARTPVDAGKHGKLNPQVRLARPSQQNQRTTPVMSRGCSGDIAHDRPWSPQASEFLLRKTTENATRNAFSALRMPFKGIKTSLCFCLKTASSIFFWPLECMQRLRIVVSS